VLLPKADIKVIYSVVGSGETKAAPALPKSAVGERSHAT
jgi:hypothetical protein